MSQKERTALAQIIRDRRAVKKHYNDKVVEESLVRNLLEDAIWAPTHAMRQPWRFLFIPKSEIPGFAKKIAATYPEEKQADRERYMNEPSAILAVIMEDDFIPKKSDENYGATASMIQNLWLLAWEQELGMVWKTNPHIYTPEIKEILGAKENEKVVGLIHMGYFDRKPIRKPRTPLDEKFEIYHNK